MLLVMVLFFGHVLIGWVFSNRIIDEAFTPPQEPGPPADVWEFATPRAAGVDVTEIRYETPLGLMDAWVTDGTRSEWIIHIHGRGATRAEALRAMRFLDDAGYHQMAITYRNDIGQPADPSGQYRYGATESDDLAAAVQYARDAGADDIVLYGYSTGAAIAQNFVVRQPLGTVSAMIYDSPNLDLARAIDFAAESEKLFGLPLPATVPPIARFFTALRIDINWGNFEYLDSAKALSTPVLVFHGTEDATIPLDVSSTLVEARPDLVRLVVTDGADHVASWNLDPATYESAVIDFLAN